MIFLQALYSMILEAQLGLRLDEHAQRRKAQVLSVERKHRRLS